VARQPSRSTAYCTSIRSGGQSECPRCSRFAPSLSTLPNLTAPPPVRRLRCGSTRFPRPRVVQTAHLPCVAVPCLKTRERPRPAAEFQKIIDNLWISSSRTRFCSAGGSTEYAWAATRIARFTRAASHNQLDKPVGFSPDSYPLLWFWIWNRCRVCRTVTKMPSRLASAELFWSK